MYYGYQQSRGGYQYYFSGLKGAALNQREVDTDSPSMPVHADNIPETAKTQGVEVFATKPNTEKVIMEENSIETGVKGSDGVEKLSKIEL
jgi:hypothetical protein